MSRQLVYFFEDMAHERFICALVRRAAQAKGVEIEEHILNATHGSKVWKELRQFLRELAQAQMGFPDVLIIVIDGNCRGHRQVQREIVREIENARVKIPIQQVVCAIPDPHIERWYLEDQHALASALPGAHIQKPRYKCERDRYKNALKAAIRHAGVEPILGGAEYGADVARALEPSRMDRSFRAFWQNLQKAL